jgi:hypothetical protein
VAMVQVCSVIQQLSPGQRSAGAKLLADALAEGLSSTAALDPAAGSDSQWLML